MSSSNNNPEYIFDHFIKVARCIIPCRNKDFHSSSGVLLRFQLFKMKILCSEPPLKQLQKNVLCQKCDASIAYVFIKCIVLRFSFKIAENMFETKLSTTFK